MVDDGRDAVTKTKPKDRFNKTKYLLYGEKGQRGFSFSPVAAAAAAASGSDGTSPAP